MAEFIVIIAGGRDFSDYTKLKKACDNALLSKRTTHDIIIRSGGAKGADLLGEQYAKEHGFTIQRFIPEWKNADGTTNKAAGHIRNREMADGNTEFTDKANALIAFWDGKSRGTKGMIDYAKKKDVIVRAINY